MFHSWFAQKYRQACAAAIEECYPGISADLMVDRTGHVYYSVWHLGDRLLEVTHNKRGRIEIYEFVPVK